MRSSGHASFRAPSILDGRRAPGAIAASLRAVRGVSSVTIDATSGAVSVRFDPALTGLAPLHARAHARREAPPSAATRDRLVLAARWLPAWTLAARAAFALLR